MNKGFTLVETLVSVAIFSILVAVGVGGFTNALHTQRQVAALISAHSNASIAIEQMAREMRTGYLFCNDPNNNGNPNGACAFHCTIAGSGSGNIWTCTDFLDFYNANSKDIVYRLNAGALERSQNGPGGPFVPITGDNVSIKYLTFTLFGNTEGDHWTPRITVSLGMTPNSTDPALASNVLNLQTTVTANQIDCTSGGVISC